MEVRIGQRVSRGMLPLLALHTFSEYYRSDHKPPVTAALIAANTLIYLRPSLFDSLIPPIQQVWFNPHLILKHKDLKRFLLSPFYHIGEPHLVYNMLSLLWKGFQLETSMGSVNFASMVASLLLLSQGVTLILSKSLLLLFDYDKPYYNEYAVGFSGVLFAMKVVLNSQSSDYSYVHGVIVPSRYAAWAELILVQLLVPGVSFIGHLGGILAGLLYVKLRNTYSGSNPITLLVRGVTDFLKWPFKFLPRRGRITGRGTVGTNRGWRCQTCTYDNDSGLRSVCEMCGTSRGVDGLSSFQRSSRPDGLPLDELRRRRLDRFLRNPFVH
ncbi:rhomboid-like protein 14, mitochondrial isoform X1 [Vigna unguiculata]|uniref:rhomboid-like protein 14, mitochondrial isoform X1 n=2 Tax=Vigna unguiculata TaxID=3917 RepID=UPI0010164839|nr:rhomboid-like protein 14, mitochondrial isoform X1 [Vigna unguiculata]